MSKYISKYFCIRNIHVFIDFYFTALCIQFGTFSKSYAIEISYGKRNWHNGLFTIAISKARIIEDYYNYFMDPSDIENWSFYEFNFYPIGIRTKNRISSEELIINELIDENDWKDISRNKYLTYKQLEEFKDKLDWNIISRRYKMNYKFIIRNSDKIVLNELANNRKISKKLKQKIIKNLFKNI